MTVTSHEDTAPHSTPWAAGGWHARSRAAMRRLALPALGFTCGLAAAGPLLGGGLRAGQAGAQAGAIAPPIGAMEAALAEAAAATERAEALVRRIEQAETLRGPRGDRFIAAALLLQAAVATPRPWLREYQALASLAPPGALPAPLAEMLLSHAARGLPTNAELRERYAALMPQLLARAPRDEDVFGRTLAAVRSTAAGIGLAAPPSPSNQEQAIAGVAQQLRRGNLAAAVADASALDAALQPLLAGWLAQASARLAVEQAIHETLLRALLAPGQPA
ncbi:hypothetical protein [Falsiroseomonas sp.]|uniref:hypothetical protein n=1 Tax=Falsiroseomonas sp. TaxID=2870721 RepID=UPI003566FDF5